MKHLRLTFVLLALAFTPTLAKADSITYTLNQLVSADASDFFTVTGTVTTDGRLGTISTADITAFDLVVKETRANQTQALELSSPGSVASGGGYLAATTGTLTFDFSQGGLVDFGGFGTGNLVLETRTYRHIDFSCCPKFVAVVVWGSVGMN